MTLILRRWVILIHGLILRLSLHVDPARADPTGPPPDPYGPSFNPSMGVVIIVLLGALFLMGFFSIYIRHYSQEESISGSSQRRVLMGSMTRARRAPRGLDRAVIDSFPTFDYSSVKELKIGKGALECAVCLSEFEDDDLLRLLPNCDHVFHPECIDAWLVGHTTCPVCRSELVPRNNTDAGDVSLHVPMETDNNNVDVVDGTSVGVESSDHEEEYVQEVQLHRNRTMRRDISFGRPRWLGRMRFGRSFSTGHVAVKQWEDVERFTLRLPEEIRKQLVSGKLERTISLVVLPRETSSRRGYRTGTGTGTGFGEGSSRGGWFGTNRSDRWVFSLIPPFFSRASSIKSPKVVDPESRRGSVHGSIRSDTNRLPVL